MLFSCFRPVGGTPVDAEDGALPRPRPAKANPDRNAKRKTTFPRRNGSNQSRTSSNSSISQLAPVTRMSDPDIERMMMPVPPEPRPSRCLRMSHPKTYGDIITSMKASKGCRDWRNFPVFYEDEIDEKVSAEQYAHRKRTDYERKLRELSSFSSGDETDQSVIIDMIG